MSITTQIWVELLTAYAVTREILLQLPLQAAQCVPVIVIFLVKMHPSSQHFSYYARSEVSLKIIKTTREHQALLGKIG